MGSLEDSLEVTIPIPAAMRSNQVGSTDKQTAATKY